MTGGNTPFEWTVEVSQEARMIIERGVPRVRFGLDDVHFSFSNFVVHHVYKLINDVFISDSHTFTCWY